MQARTNHSTSSTRPTPRAQGASSHSGWWVPLVLLVLLGHLQGCMLGVAWVAVVGTDTALLGSGDVEMQPFENSWVALPGNRGTFQAMDRIAVSPIFQPKSSSNDLIVLSPAQPRQLSRQDWLFPADLSEQDEARVAKNIGEQYGVDCVLFGRVVDEPNQDPKARHRLRHYKRLYIHMVGSDGSLLWKDELPFIVVVGRDLPSDEQVWHALMGQVMDRAEQLDLTGPAQAPTAG